MGEINRTDEFGSALIKSITDFNLGRILEIGSWDGTGSTACLIEGMLKLQGEKKLICLEVNADRYLQLVRNTEEYKWVECHNKTSITYNQLCEKEFDKIWDSPFNGLKKHATPPTKEQVKIWFDEDIKNLKDVDVGFLEADNNFYDAVLIDGGEFFGYSEYKLIKDRTNVLFLDDYYYAYKTNQIARELVQDEEWEVVAGNRNVRSGYAIFKRKVFLNK